MSSRVSLRRTSRPRSSDVSDDFSTESARSSAGGFVRPVVASLVVAFLSVGVAAGVMVASAHGGTEQNQSSIVVDDNTPDQSKAEPVDQSLSAEQIAAKKSDEQSKETAEGGLKAFGERGSTVNRSSVRMAINGTLTAGSSSERNDELQSNSSMITLTQAQAEQKQREKQMDADIAKVKREAKRIAEEKKKAEELLRNANKPGSGAGGGVSLGDLSAILSANGGASMPVPLGRATLGAHWGKTGSWARYHTGQDFPAPSGTPIFAAAPGVVGNSTGASGWAGNYVVIHHANGGSTLYAHMSGKVAQPGQVVKAGQIIGYVGNTGRSFGSHLHFEYYPPGTTPGDVYSSTDPMAFLRSIGVGR